MEQATEGGGAAKNKNATRAMWLAIGSVIGWALTGIPAVICGVLALRSGNPSGRGRAWFGIVAGALFSAGGIAACHGAWSDSQARHAKAEAEAPARIAEARAALDAGNMDAVVQTVAWLRDSRSEVPSDLGVVVARGQLAKARAAFAEKRWDDARRMAGDAKGYDKDIDDEADQIKSKIEPERLKARWAEEDAAKVKASKERTIKESCAQLARMFGPDSKMSELQKEAAWKDYEGKEFNWDLEMVEADSSFLGGYVVSWKCAKGSPSLIYDIHMSYRKGDKGQVLSLKKGAIYGVRGRLKRSGTLLGIGAEAL